MPLGERQVSSYQYDGLVVRRSATATDYKSVVQKIAGNFSSAARLTLQTERKERGF